MRTDAAVPSRTEPRVASPDRPRVLSSRGRLSVGALGTSLTLIVGVAWGTALFYLAARLGVDPHVRLAWIDAAHVYVGLVGGTFVVAKVSRVRFRYQVSGISVVAPWQRWISWSLLILYSAVFVSGVLLLVPIHGKVYGDLINFHLLSAVWAVAPTTWHVWHYRRKATPFLTRILPRGRSLGFWAGICLAILPATGVIGNARSLSQLPQVLGGSVWSPAALSGSYLDLIIHGPDGALVAAGDALYVSRDGAHWTQIEIPGATQRGARSRVLSLASVGGTIYIGTDAGLYRTASITGPLEPLGFAGRRVSAIAVDPINDQTLWVGSSAGLMQSPDGGTTWIAAASGLQEPNSVVALGFFGARLFASDQTGVFSWDLDQNRWSRSSHLPSVIDLTADPEQTHLYATSSTRGVDILTGSAWWPTMSLATAAQQHPGKPHAQVLSVAPIGGRLYAVGTPAGVSASGDGGQTWVQLGGGLADVQPAHVVDYQGALLAATSNGIYRFPLSTYTPPSLAWWLALMAAAAGCGTCAVLLVGTAPMTWWVRRSDPILTLKRPRRQTQLKVEIHHARQGSRNGVGL
jgi:hypothetical protein